MIGYEYVWERFSKWEKLNTKYEGKEDISEKVVSEFRAKVFHPRIRSKRRFAHRRESPDFASILLVLSVLNVG